MSFSHRYLLHLQYLGFRYSGWQVQPGVRTVEGMIRKTLKFVLPGRTFKTLAAGRTDAKVSAIDQAFELFLEEALEDADAFLSIFNENLPPDIRALSIQPVGTSFNIIGDSKEKEYRYFFANAPKIHPFCAPLLVNFSEPLDIGLMKEGAKLFIGTHDFISYTVKDAPPDTTRTIVTCELLENDQLQANFFPEQTYMLRVRGTGFLRYQVRMMMGALVDLGRGNFDLQHLESSLQKDSSIRLAFVAPASGLLLYQTEFGYI